MSSFGKKYISHLSCNVLQFNSPVLHGTYLLTYLLTFVYCINPMRTCVYFCCGFKSGTRCNFIYPTQYSVSHETLKCSQVTAVLLP